MDEDVAEAPRQPLVLLGIELLVPEEDDAVIEERLADLGHGRVVEIAAQVDAMDLGAEGAGDALDLEPGRRLHVGLLG